ncbi:MAG TPA: folylpolyglutamate synthase/dihydrofolate synthase family protein [Candidatus Binatia bacterium]|jgi:dihydrofolate synthase/folylpolyglutamate synthase
MAQYSEILERIYNLRGGEIDLRLDRVRAALERFQYPQNSFPSLHIAGTNGKGSTAAILHRILSTAGYRTALYTSPHLVSFTERIRVGDQEIAPGEVEQLAEEIWHSTQAVGIQLTFFEFVTVLAFIHFARQQVEIAVVEVGLGGRLDATNVITPLVSVITTISRDHEAYLGHDLLSIAGEKGGIIKPRIPVICGALVPEVRDHLANIAVDRGALSYFLGMDFKFFLKEHSDFDYTGIKRNFEGLRIALRGMHQKRNAAVALAALETIQGYFPVDEQTIRDGLQTVSWPGRFEVLCTNPDLVLDGAHNGEGVEALVQTLREFGGGRQAKFVFASMADKDWRLILDTLLPLAREFVFTRVAMERSANPEQLARHIGDRVPTRIVPDSRAALHSVMKDAVSGDLVVVAGSLYLLGELRPVAEKIGRTKGGPTRTS